MSPAIIREMAGVLRFDFEWQEDCVHNTIRLVAQAARVIAPRTALKVLAADPADDRILECAVDGEADIIVSDDRHLLQLKAYRNIPIIAGPDFRRTLGLK